MQLPDSFKRGKEIKFDNLGNLTSSRTSLLFLDIDRRWPGYFHFPIKRELGQLAGCLDNSSKTRTILFVDNTLTYNI